jgi:hypothetical protein
MGGDEIALSAPVLSAISRAKDPRRTTVNLFLHEKNLGQGAWAHYPWNKTTYLPKVWVRPGWRGSVSPHAPGAKEVTTVVAYSHLEEIMHGAGRDTGKGDGVVPYLPFSASTPRFAEWLSALSALEGEGVLEASGMADTGWSGRSWNVVRRQTLNLLFEIDFVAFLGDAGVAIPNYLYDLQPARRLFRYWRSKSRAY